MRVITPLPRFASLCVMCFDVLFFVVSVCYMYEKTRNDHPCDVCLPGWVYVSPLSSLYWSSYLLLISSRKSTISKSSKTMGDYILKLLNNYANG